MGALKISDREIYKLMFSNPDLVLSIAKKQYLGKKLADDLEPDNMYYLYIGFHQPTGRYLCCVSKKEIVDNDPGFEEQIHNRIKYKLGLQK